MDEDNLFERLGVAPEATDKEIKAAYRLMAKKHHPDAGGDPEKFKAITEAREILLDPVRREQYETYGTYAKDRDAWSVIGSLVRPAFSQGSISPLKFIQQKIDERRSECRNVEKTKTEELRILNQRILKFQKQNEKTENTDGRDFIARELNEMVADLARSKKFGADGAAVMDQALRLLKNLNSESDLSMANYSSAGLRTGSYWMNTGGWNTGP